MLIEIKCYPNFEKKNFFFPKFTEFSSFLKFFKFHPKFQVTKFSKISKKIDKSMIFCKLEIQKN